MQIDREKVIQWARDAGMPSHIAGRISDVLLSVSQRAAEQEREACAALCDGMPWRDGQNLPSNHEMARAIRARTQESK